MLGVQCVSFLVRFLVISDLGPELENILRQSYDNAKVTIDLRRTSILKSILRRTQRFS